MLQTKPLYAVFVAASVICLPALANRMVTDTKGALNRIREAVLEDERQNRAKLRKTPKFIVKAYMTAANYDKQTIASADVARPFFLVEGADRCLKDIGSADEDIAYIQSVFTEFYGSGAQTEYRLITILHRHMMEALGLSTSKTLKEFKKMLKKIDKKGRPQALSSSQFQTYCRCVARGLFAVYWFEHGQN